VQKDRAAAAINPEPAVPALLVPELNVKTAVSAMSAVYVAAVSPVAAVRPPVVEEYTVKTAEIAVNVIPAIA